MSKKQIIAKDSVVSLGLDVDGKTTYVVVLDLVQKNYVFEGRIPHDPEGWYRFLARFENCEISAYYEASCTGFWLCRFLRGLGVDCQVVAPTAVPKEAERKRRKNDRQDAKTLSLIALHPPEHFVRVPTEQEEDDRELIRTREQLLREQTRIQQEIKSKLLFHHIDIPKEYTKRRVSKAYLEWVCQCAPEGSSLCIALGVLVSNLEFVRASIRKLDKAIKQLSQQARFKADYDRLQQIKGIGILTKMTFLTEVFRPEEIETAEQLASKLGLTPCEYSSGERFHQGHITRWGSRHLRRILTQAAWVWIRKDMNAKSVFEDISYRRGKKKAIVGIARRLAIAMWAMTVKEQDYDYHWVA